MDFLIFEISIFMGYDSKHTEILSSQEGYNLIAVEYTQYHKHLDSFYNIDIQRFVPRDNEGLKILDLGAGDGRVYQKHFQNIAFGEYIACDVAEELLDKHPIIDVPLKKSVHGMTISQKSIETMVLDLEKELPLEDNYFDVVTSFFVLEHIENLQSLFSEIYRIMRSGGVCIIGHFLQRRSFEWNKDRRRFKIKQYKYSLKDLQEVAEYNFFKFNYFPQKEKENLLGYIVVCEK